MWPMLISLCLALSGGAPRKAAPRRRPTFRRSTSRPHLEALEDRCLLSAGALDTTFGGTGVVTTSLSKSFDYAGAVLTQSNGSIVEAGTAGVKSGQASAVIGLVRYNADGTLDSTFGSGGEVISKMAGGFHGAALDPGITDTHGNAAIVVGCNNGNSVARFNPNGSLDTSFGKSGTVTVSYTIVGVLVQQVGTSYDIVAAGSDSNGVIELTRFTASGKVDTTFGSNGAATLSIAGAGGVSADAFALQSDGKLVLGGEGEDGAGSDTSFYVARFTASGALDTTFGSGNGSVATSFTTAAGTDRALVIRLTAYPATGTDTADSGKIVAACTISGNNVNPGALNDDQIALARFNSDGSPDATFGSSGQVVTPFPYSAGQGFTTALQPDGKILVAGDTANAGNWNFSLLRYNRDGSLDGTFTNTLGSQIFPNGGLVVTPSGTPNSRAWSVAVQPDGRIVAAGDVQAAAGSGDYNFMTARYLAGPEIGTFTASASTANAGSGLTLTASNVSDGDPGATITQVAFYAIDGNGNQYLLGTGTLSSGVWTLNYTVGLASGSYTLFAQATDSDGIIGDSAFLPLTVQ